MPLTEISPTGRFARISTDHPTHRPTPPIDYPSGNNVVIESVLSSIFPANRSYSQNGLSQDLSVYEKGSGAEYMAAAGWTGSVATDSRRHRPIPKSSIKFTKSSYNNRSRWLCTFLVIVALLLILIIIAIIVLLATRVFIINPNRTITTTTMSSSTRVQQSGSSSSSSVIMITTPSGAVSSLKPPNTNSSSTFNCTIYIINQANSRYNDRNSFEYADASQILRQALVALFQGFYRSSFIDVIINSLTNAGTDLAVNFRLLLQKPTGNNTTGISIESTAIVQLLYSRRNSLFGNIRIDPDRIYVSILTK